MDHILHRPASVGGLIKKILSVNPDLGVSEIAAIIRQATVKRVDGNGEYGSTEIVDEKLAIEIAIRSSK